MQYQFAGQDALGRLIYQPVAQPVAVEQQEQQPYVVAAEPVGQQCACQGCHGKQAHK